MLAGLLAWALWAHPEARRAALAASAAAAVGFLPWWSGLRGDLSSPTTDILSALQPFDLASVRTSLAHWAIGFPYATPITRVADVPGVPALIALAVAIALGAGGLLLAWRETAPSRIDRRLVLVIVFAAATPVGEALVGAVGSNLFGTRNLAVSWPGVALCLAALLLAAGRRAGPVAAALAIVAFAVGGLKLLDPDIRRPDYEAAIAFIEQNASPGDIVVDGVSLSPAGVPSTIDAAFAGRQRVLPLGRDEVRYDPFRIVERAPPAGRRRPARGARRRGGPAVPGRVAPAHRPTREVLAALPPGSRRIASREYRGLDRIAVVEVEPQTASGA